MPSVPQGKLFTNSLPAIRGVQAGREYYATIVPLGLLERVFKYEESEVPAEFRAQRTLNRVRIPELTRYITENPSTYVFSAITASVDGNVEFTPFGSEDGTSDLGLLSLDIRANLLINDGQHRRAAIIEALKEHPELRDEEIAVVLFVDAGLKRSQQMFADLNTHAVRAARSLGVLYDHRDPMAELARSLLKTVTIFEGLTEKEKTNISNRSRKLFTLSSIYQATRRLLGKARGATVKKEEAVLAVDFWNCVARNMHDWQAVAAREVSAAELRRDYISAHGIALQAVAIAGADLIRSKPKAWKRELRAVDRVDWSKSNTAIWEGRAMIGGRVSKAQNNVVLTANVLKGTLGIELTPEQRRVEELHGKGKRAQRERAVA